MPIKFSNNAAATLADGINDTATSITLATGQGGLFPSLGSGDYFYLTVGSEIVKATARSGDVLTVVRGQELTTAVAHSSGTSARLLVTAEGLRQLTPTTENLGSGTADNTTFLRGDRQWALVEGVPAGFIFLSASSTPPSGYLKANGAAVSRTTYATLFAAIGTTYGAGDGSTTFLLPDLRGEFPRFWDDGRGVDSGRALGSAQSSQNLSHQHFLVRNAYTNQYSQYGISLYTNNYIAGAGSGGYETYYLNGHTSEANVALSSPSGGTEARPRNMALLACIKF